MTCILVYLRLRKYSIFMKVKKRSGCLKTLFITIPLWFIGITIGLVLVLKWVPVWVTPVMIQKSIVNVGDSTYHTYKTWKSLKHISRSMGMAVMAGEDSRFLSHWGFDFVEINNAITTNAEGNSLRGASTISQQTAKNVFLLPGRTWLRKGLEAYFTLLIEGMWGKRRIMEVYLNVAEMGKGIFGAEAAAQHLFNTSAEKLTRRQCALVAATLPNPLVMHSDRPSRYVRYRATVIQSLMRKIPRPKWLGGTETRWTQRMDRNIKKRNGKALMRTVKKVNKNVGKKVVKKFSGAGKEK